MYCTLEYIQLPRIEDESSPLLQQILTYQSNQGLDQENKKMLFNPNCPVQILLEYLCEEVGLDRSVDFDLCESETGYTVNIKQLNSSSYATNFLKNKQSYVLIIFERDTIGAFKVLEPLLNKQSKEYTDVLNRVKRQKGIIRRSTQSSKKPKRHGSGGKLSVSSNDYVSSKR